MDEEEEEDPAFAENKKKLWDAILELREKNPEIKLSENDVPDDETLRKLRKKYDIEDVFDPTERQRKETLLIASTTANSKTVNQKLNILLSKQ
jgi:hypothetical protein